MDDDSRDYTEDCIKSFNRRAEALRIQGRGRPPATMSGGDLVEEFNSLQQDTKSLTARMNPDPHYMVEEYKDSKNGLNTTMQERSALLKAEMSRRFTPR